MEISISNENLEITVNSYGGELTKLYNKENKIDYLFNRDEKYWGFQAPILFPIVGGLKNDSFLHDGKSYPLTKHGFARTTEFDVEKISDNEICASLSFDENTLKQYPFKFMLEIKYTLEKNSVCTKYTVKNLDTSEIFFTIGGHPAFNCPINKEGKFTDYYLEFEKNEVGASKVIGTNGFFTEKEDVLFNNSNKLPLKYNLFEPDAIVFENLNSGKVTLKSDKFPETLTFDYEEYPIIAFWTKCKEEAPFLCIEPWFGHGDYDDYKGDFVDRDGVVSLEVNNVFETKYIVTVK